MAAVVVNNISNRTKPAGGARAVDVGPSKIWPGTCAVVDSSEITPSLLLLEGTYLAFGHLPMVEVSATKSAPMTEVEFKEYLEKLSLRQLLALGLLVTPPITTKDTAPRMVHALVRAYRDPIRLDPKTFFFTRRWVKEDSDTFVLMED